MFYVVKQSRGNLLSFRTGMSLGVVNIVRSVTSAHECVVKQLLSEFSSVFEGVGLLKNHEVKLHIDSNVTPVYQKHRRVPFAVREKVENEIKRLTEQGIIETPTGPTPWVSPVVVVPKPNDPNSIRLCVDMRAANKAIKRVKHPMPTVDELIHDLNGCTVFSKLDLSMAYNQLSLAPESRHITVFSTHLGVHQYKRLFFGVNAASEIFQQTIEQTLSGLKGVKNISDDIIIASKDVQSHEKHVRACLKRLKENGLTVNKKKCEFFKPSIMFFGNMFGENGLSADPHKVEAIKNVAPPSDKSEVKSLLGMANYVSRFIPNLATIVRPMREMTRENVPFVWSKSCNESLSKLKEGLTSDTVMSYFEPGLETELIVDASPCGLGAMLCQYAKHESHVHDVKRVPRVVSYASCTLSDVQTRYSQTEREALAIKWAVEHFHLYLYGINFTVITDHKPLVSIFKNPLARPSARIERWCLSLQSYEFDVVYRQGKYNPADYMSRHPVSRINPEVESDTKEYVQFVCNHATPNALTVNEISEATASDVTLQNVIKCLENGKWYLYDESEEINAFEKVQSELSYVGSVGVLLKGTKIVIPLNMRKRVVSLAHQGHQGIVKTKALIRGKVWFPGIDNLVEETVKTCEACQVVSKDVRLHPLQMSELPDYCWQKVSADFAGPFPSGDYALVIIDEYSRYPVVEIVKSTSSRVVIPVFDKIFSMFGIPEVVKTDNGTPFQSHEFKEFSKLLGFRHRKITPLWPMANSQSENFMKPLIKACKTANAEGKSWKQELYSFLRNYRATPHVTTNEALLRFFLAITFEPPCQNSK